MQTTKVGSSLATMAAQSLNNKQQTTNTMPQETEIIVVDGNKVRRTTTTTDEVAPDLQTEVDKLDEQIASTIARYVKPLKVQRRKLVRKMADLDVIISDVG